MSRWSGLAAAALLLVGCGDVAILSLAIELPEGIAGAEVRFLSSQAGFDDAAWASAPSEPLDEVGELAEIDVVASGATIEAPLALRLSLCETTPCAFDAPEVRAELERAFYLGRRTRYRIVIPFVPRETEAPRAVGRCDVGGCIGGDGLETYCRMDGTHYCE